MTPHATSRREPPALRPLVGLALAAALALSGCSNTGFYWQAARGQLDLLSRRVPIEKVLEDEDVSAATRARIRVAWEARRFASADLGLPDNRSYETYADLERPYALWNVFAAPEFSVAPKTWCFLFAGCVSYRGYFKEDSARRQMQALRADGFDAFYGGVAAYSTLGRFADPILNTMLHQDELHVVALIFHELAHQELYRPSDADFSESFASFVEREGVRRWLAKREQSADYDRYLQSLDYQRQFAELVIVTREKLEAVYASGASEEAMRKQKRRVFENIQTDYAALKTGWGGYAGYDVWFARELNNAHLASVNTYQRWVPAFRQLLADADDDLPAFFARARELAKLDDALLEEKLTALGNE